MARNMTGYSHPFINQYVKIPKRISDRVDADHSREYEGVRHCIGLIIVNLLVQGEVAYSRNSNFYTEKHTRHYTRTNMWNAVNIAIDRGYAVRSLEGYKNPSFTRGLSSTLGPGPKLNVFKFPIEVELDVGSLPLLSVDKRQVFDEDGLTYVLSHPKSVSPESQGLLPLLPNLYGDALSLNRDYWNRMEIGRRSLSAGSYCMGKVGLTRVFKGGGVGRWFQRGELSYQQLPKEQRARLLLDGEEVIEQDYHAMHPHILYAWEGQQCPEDFYERTLDLCGCTRDVAKKMTLIAVNAGNYSALVSATNFGRRREAEPSLYDELKRLGLEPRSVVQALVEAHPIMEGYVFSGQALRLMLVESEVMTSVLLNLMEVGIPALPVHDSLIAPSRDREQVRQEMEYAYRQHTGFSIVVA